jgi:hypothetical protein
MKKVRKKPVRVTSQNKRQSPVVAPVDAPLSPQWAFVVQFRAPAAGGPAWEAGRVEHLVSGHTSHFQSLEELAAFFAQALQEGASPAA